MKNDPSSTELVHASEQQLAAPSANQPPSLTEMLSAVIKGGITSDNVGVLKEMMGMHERLETRNAEKEFNSAFVALQQNLPTIIAKSEIKNRGRYAKYEDIMHEVGPLLRQHGFSVDFDMEAQDKRVKVTCHLRHIAGHSKSNSFAVRVGPADSETQSDCKAATTAKRNALTQALSLVIRQDALIDGDDVSIEGEVLSPDKALFLREQLKEVGGNEVGFLAVAGVDSWDKITVGSYDVLFRLIQSKRKK